MTNTGYKDRTMSKIELEGLGHVEYMANSPYTVADKSYNAGHLYDKIGETAEGTVLYVLPKGVLCYVNVENPAQNE